MENRIFIASDTKVFRDATKLFGHIIDMTPRFPKDYKYTVGGQMQSLSMNLMLRIQHAFQIKEERQTQLKLFLGDFEVLQVLLRTAGERHWISRAQHAEVAELMINIGKQITAWKNRSAMGEGRNPEVQG